MYTRFGMGAFLENPMFLFVDDAEPILPTFRSSEYGDSGRIVELADVGCDTETTFPMYFPRGAFDRRRGGAESFGSTRRIAKWRNERPRNFSRAAAILNNNEGKGRNYIGGKAKRNNRDYDNVYVADLDYDSCTECPYDDFGFTNNDSAAEYKDDYYTQFVKPQNIMGSSRKEHLSRDTRYNYSKDLESPFTQNIRAHQRANISPRWFTDSNERNLREIRDTSVRSSEREKRTKIFSRMDENFNRGTELAKARDMKRRERDNFFNATNSMAFSKDDFWDIVSLENEVNCEELIFSDLTRIKNHSGLQRKMVPQNRVPHNSDSQQERIDVTDSEREEEPKEISQKNSQEKSPKIPIRSARYRISKSDAVTEKPKILRSNTLNANSPRVRSARTSIDERISNMYPAGKSSVNMRPRSAIGGKETNINYLAERREEITDATRMNANDHRYRKFINKLSNNADEMSRSARTFKRNADSRRNEKIYAANEKDNTNSHPRNSGNSKVDRTIAAVSQSAPEEKIMKNERTFALRMIDASSRIEIEKEKKRKFSSRLPVRTWKRLRTKEPAALRLENDITNDDVRKVQGMDIEIINSNDFKKIEDDEVHEEIAKNHATTDRSDINRSNRFRTGLYDKSKLTSRNLKNIKGIKGLNAMKGTDEQRKKRMNIK